MCPFTGPLSWTVDGGLIVDGIVNVVGRRAAGKIDGVDPGGKELGLVGSVTPSHKGFRYPAEIISHGVWRYHRFPLSLR
jgi:hypothetical protein